MKRSLFLILAATLLSLIYTCKQEPYVAAPDQPGYLHKSVNVLTTTIVHDIFSPPVASRIYAYASVAAYETAVQGRAQSGADMNGFASLAGRLNELTVPPAPPAQNTWDVTLATVHAFLLTGKALIFSEDSIAKFENAVYAEMQKNRKIPQDVYDNSMMYGKQMADHILAWSAGDNYKQTRTFPKYTITNDPSKWQPTPPAYIEGIEPSWNLIRTFVLDSADQFIPHPPTEFSLDKESKFYQEAMEVYTATDTAQNDYSSRIEIAKFWDCNPYVQHQQGHVMFATKKITPGGHWIGITGQACRQNRLDLTASARAYAYTAVALADAFISCWDEKYRSNLVRPETYINKYIDPDWLPNLQTPPFPEHTSGHSVISSAGGEMLTALIGDNIAFVDSVELEYGLPLRKFTSFRDAYQEAAISRLYGGIHYRPSIDYGIAEGRKVGAWCVQRLVNGE
jgi:hypothetical protein